MTGSGGPPGAAVFLKPIQEAIQRSTHSHQAWLAFWQQQMAEGFKTMQALAFCRTPAEVAELHATFVRESAARAKAAMQGGPLEAGLPPVTAPAPPEPVKAPPAAAPAETPPEAPAQTAPIPAAEEAAKAADALEATAEDVAAQMNQAADVAAADGPDDLKQINGIGPAAEKTLKGLGYTRFAQIAALGPDDITRIEEHMRFKGRIERDDWVGQAKILQGG